MIQSNDQDFTLSTDNIKIHSGFSRTSLWRRLPDIDVGSGAVRTPEELAKIEAFNTNFGHAGPTYIRHLIGQKICDDPKHLLKEVDEIVAKLADGQSAGLRRAARPFAIAQRAGELAFEAGLIDDVAAVRRAIEMCWTTFLASDEAATANGSEAMLEGFKSWVQSQIDVTIISASSFEGAAPPSNSDGRGQVIGWYTDVQIILDWKLLESMKIPNTFGKRTALCKALEEIGALDRSSSKNIPYSSLPKEVGVLPNGGDKTVKNVRMYRDKLGV